MAKKSMKIYFSMENEGTIKDTTFCCGAMKRGFYNFEFDLFETEANKTEPLLLIKGSDDEYMAIDFCPFCGAKIIIKPSRLE